MTPSRPYFLRALNDWIVANALTPHLLVNAERPGVNVPQQYVKDGQIVLNIAPQAINNLTIANDWVSFDARFSGVLHRIRIPVMAILGIYAVENGRGMMFDHEEEGDDELPPEPPVGSKDARPSLKVVK